MSELRRVLIVSYFYPPDGSVGGRRVAKFAEYLPRFGWSAAVLTARNATDDAPDPDVHATRLLSPWGRPGRPAASAAGGRAALRERLGRGGRLRRGLYFGARHLLPMSSVRLPDATLGWIPFALREGRRLLSRERFDAILSSSGPPSSHLVAARLQRRSGLPWVADYRDPWSDNPWDHRIAPFRRLERRLERRSLRGAAALTTADPAWTAGLSDLHGRTVEVVYNGFDPADYPATVERAPGFTITYVGSITPGQDPTPLFRALELLDPRRLQRNDFQIHFLGTDPGIVEPLAQRHDAARWVRRIPPVPHREALARQAASQALLYLGWAGSGPGPLTAKLFEYLGARRPILPLGPPGTAASRILRECALADMVADPRAIADRISAWLDEFERTGDLPQGGDPDARGRYTRRAQTGRLARILGRVADRGTD